MPIRFVTSALAPVCLAALILVAAPGAASAQSCDYAGMAYAPGDQECIEGRRATCVANDDAPDGAAFEISDAPCHHRIEITNAKYGVEDHWCAATTWVERFCAGRLTCEITVPKGSLDTYSYEARRALKDEVVCGPISVVERYLAISWFCTDGEDYFTQPRTTIADGNSDTMTCARY